MTIVVVRNFKVTASPQHLQSANVRFLRGDGDGDGDGVRLRTHACTESWRADVSSGLNLTWRSAIIDTATA